jgi:hypothetical protein
VVSRGGGLFDLAIWRSSSVEDLYLVLIHVARLGVAILLSDMVWDLIATGTITPAHSWRVEYKIGRVLRVALVFQMARGTAPITVRTFVGRGTRGFALARTVLTRTVLPGTVLRWVSVMHDGGSESKERPDLGYSLPDRVEVGIRITHNILKDGDIRRIERLDKTSKLDCRLIGRDFKACRYSGVKCVGEELVSLLGIGLERNVLPGVLNLRLGPLVGVGEVVIQFLVDRFT